MFVPGQLLVRFRPTVARERSEQVIAAEGAVRWRRIEALGVDVLRLPPGLSVERAVKVFRQMAEVEFAEPNYILRIAEINDPGLDKNQWAPKKIEARAAWETMPTPGDPAIIIAVVDTGIDYRHSELVPNMWENPGEIPGNGLDDDNNGYVDDVQGWDFINGDADPLDDHSHGTHVAGIAAADDNDNPDGLVGICPDCNLMAVKVLAADGAGPLDKVANGITYAVDNGARVINLSLTGPFPASTLESAVNRAWDQGVVVVAAAGNDGAETLRYPAAYANVMAVASTNADDHRSCYSNYSDGYIDVAAPGEAIYSTLPKDESGKDAYGVYSGTSMAAPHVSGLAGLLFSQDLARTNAQVRDLIETTTEDLGPTGTDAYFGTGRINAHRAVTGDTSATTSPAGLFSNFQTASAYAHTRKLARDAGGTLHLAWHGQEGSQYRVLYATSTDGGQSWNAPQTVFASSAETYHPALGLGSGYVYVAFPSKEGASYYQTFFTRKPLQGGDWSPPAALMGGAYDAVRPDLFVDPSNGKLHLVASSLDNAQYVYYRTSSDGGATWGPVRSVDPTTSSTASNSRYATVHANGPNVYIAARTVAQPLFTVYYLHTVRSTDGGESWFDQMKISSYQAVFTGEYGVSLAGVGDRLYMVYEVGGGLYFRRWDGMGWSDYLQLEGSGAWPTVTQADDGQAWMMWVSSGSLLLRHYTGDVWEPGETVLEATSFAKAYYPNLKLSTSADRVEWVATHCSGAPYRLTYDSRAIGASNPPVASAGGPYSGTEDVAIAFDGSGSSDPDGDPLSYSWDFGDGTTGTGVSLSHAYAYGGTFTVILTVSDGKGGTDTDSTTATVVEVNDPPVADPNGPYSGTVGAPVASDGSGSFDPDNQDGTTVNDQTLTYMWDFGDGGTGTGASPSHTYSEAGDYTVSLVVNDGFVDSAPATTTASVAEANKPPVATFAYSCTDLACDFDASGSNDPDLGGSIVSYAWDFGDGNSGSGVTASHTYASAGTYSVVLTVTDNDGATDTDTQPVTVHEPPKIHVGDLDGYGVSTKNTWTANVVIAVHDSSHDPVANATVNGSWSNGATGTAWCITEAGGLCQVSMEWIPKKLPKVDFTVDTVTHPSLAYQPASNHDPDGDSDGTTITVSKDGGNQPPVASFTYGCSGLTCDFDASASYDPDGSIVSYAWNFGDESTGSVETTSHTYAAEGTYTVVLTVTDDGGATDADSKPVTVSEGGGGTMHVGDLDGSSAPGKRNRWDATVTITIHDQDESPLANATVTGTWSDGATGSASCTTDGSGQCSVSKVNIKDGVGSVTFTVDMVTHQSNTYSSSDNDDPDPDSNGTTIIVYNKP
jgi:PKD repeat protein